MGSLDRLEDESVYSDESYSGKLKPDADTVKLALDMLTTCFNLSAITEAFPKVDPVGSRINNAWLVLSKTVQSFTDDLLPASKKIKALAEKVKKVNKYERQKKQKTGGTLGRSVERAFTEGEMISARFKLNVGVSKKGENELGATIEDVLEESKEYAGFIEPRYWRLATSAFRKFNAKYAEIESWEERLAAIGKAANEMKDEARDRLQVYYSYHEVNYKFIKVDKVYALHLNNSLDPLLVRLDKVVEMLKTLREKAIEFGIEGFRQFSLEDKYVVNMKSILEDNAFQYWEPSQHRLIFLDESMRKARTIKIEVEVKKYLTLLKKHAAKQS